MNEGQNLEGLDISNLVPVGNKVLLKRKRKDLGIWHESIENDRGDHPMYGDVLAVGELEESLVPANIQKGDVVCFVKFSDTKLFIDDEEVLFVDGPSILGVFRENKV